MEKQGIIKYSIYTLDLVRALESSSTASWKTSTTFIDSTDPNNLPGNSKESKNEIQFPANHIVLPWPTYTERRAKRGRFGIQP